MILAHLKFSVCNILCSTILIVLPVKAQARTDAVLYPDHYASAIDDQNEAQVQIEEVPGNAQLIDKDQFENERALTIKDITDYAPGVYAQPRDGAEALRLSVRGSGLANTFQGRGLEVLQDGIPINMADGEFEFPVIDPWLIQYAEVFPGANALQFGASTFGGAINFITPTGVTANGVEIKFEAGSFGELHSLLSDGEKWDGGDFYIALSGFREDGFRDHNDQLTERINANFGWNPTADFSNRIYFSHTKANAQIPGAISQAVLDDDAEAANSNNINGNYERNLDITRIADKAAWINGQNRIDTTVFYTYRTLDNPVTTYEEQHNNDVGVQAEFTHQYGESQWLAGINNYYGDAIETRFQNIGGQEGNHILSRDLYAMTNEAYGEVQQHIDGGLFGIAGAQVSNAARNIDQSFPANVKQDEDYFGFSPRIGLRYDINQTDQLFANLSRSFEPPTFSELSGGNNPGFNYLKAQRATTAEIGARWDVDKLHWNAAYYHGWLSNEFVQYDFQNGDRATINAARSKRDGVELGVNGNIFNDAMVKDDAVELRAAYTYSHFTLDDDPLYGNNQLPGVPENYLRAEMIYHYPSGISFGPNVEWSPNRQPVDLTNSLYSDSYAIYGARVFWESEDGSKNVYLEGRNLLNKTYAATYNVVPNAAGVDGRYFYPGEGRAVYAGFGWKL